MPGTRRPAENKSSCPRFTEFTQKPLFCDVYLYQDEKCFISGYEILVILHSPSANSSSDEYAQMTERWIFSISLKTKDFS